MLYNSRILKFGMRVILCCYLISSYQDKSAMLNLKYLLCPIFMQYKFPVWRAKTKKNPWNNLEFDSAHPICIFSYVPIYSNKLNCITHKTTLETCTFQMHLESVFSFHCKGYSKIKVKYIVSTFLINHCYNPPWTMNLMCVLIFLASFIPIWNIFI